MIVIYLIVSVWLLGQGGRGEFLQYYYTDLNNEYIAPIFTQPQIYHQDQTLYYTQNVNTNIKPAILTQKHLFSDSYRGFSYHTAYDNGATSTVVFLKNSGSDLQSVSNRMTVASDILDPQSNVELQIHKALEGPHFEISPKSTGNGVANLSPFVKALLETKQSSSSLTHYYSVDNYPVNTKPLAIANSVNNKTNNATSSTDNKETADSTEVQIRVNKMVNDEININHKNVTVTESTVANITSNFTFTSTLSAITTTTTESSSTETIN